MYLSVRSRALSSIDGHATRLDQRLWGVIFEGDNSSVKELIIGKARNFALHNLIREVQHWKKRFTQVEFHWSTRQSNKAADRLAKEAIPNNSPFITHFYVPSFLVQTLHEDYTASL